MILLIHETNYKKMVWVQNEIDLQGSENLAGQDFCLELRYFYHLRKNRIIDDHKR